MLAQRARLTAATANMAAKDSVYPDGTPYRAKQIYFAPGDPSSRTREGRQFGVHVAAVRESRAEFGYRWDPGSDFAIKSGPKAGHVRTSNVDPITEQVNAIQATRAYEANVVAAETTKSMIQQALRLLA